MKVPLRTLLAALTASLVTAACGGTTSTEPDAAAVSAAPAAAANLAVTWTIQEGSTGGSVSTSGLYTAPGGAGTYHVIVTSVGDTTKSATATVTVAATSVVAISLSPATASVTTGGTVRLTATVTGSSNTGVNWSVVEGSGAGSVSGGVYTAPSTAGTYHVQAQSQADTSKTAQATITVTPAAQQVAISVTPTTASVSAGGTVQISATVTGTSNTSVSWSVLEGSGGGSVSGGVYTAPATAGTYHVQAQSQADTSKTAQATITVTGGSQQASSCTTAPMTGTVYYYCDCATGVQGGNPDSGCVAGNDSNPGTSPSLPRRSLSDAMSRFNSMGAGNTVALCRGGTWSGSVDFTNTSCTASSPCYWRDYAPSWGQGANNNRPRIGNGGTTLAVQNSPTRGHYRIWGMDVRNPAQGGANGVVLVYNTQVHDVDFCNLRVDGGWLGVYFEPQNTDNTQLSLRDSQIYNGQFSGFYGGGPGVTITGNYFEGNGINTGSGGMLMHSAYLISEVGGYPTEPTSALPYVFSNNEIVEGSYCDGVMLVVHGVFRNNHLVIENNYLHSPSTNPQCYGFQTAGGLAGAEFHNVSFRRNRVNMVSGTGVEYSCCADCNFTDNVFTGSGVWFSSGDCNAGSFTAGQLTIQNNTFYGVGMAIGSNGNGPYDMDNNAAWMNSGTCYSVAGHQGRNNNNYCRSGSGAAATSVFANPSAGDFTPVAGGPLDGTGNATYHSTTAIGTPAWSKTDAGVTRSTPIDIGAFQR
jgi:hypothetical protein